MKVLVLGTGNKDNVYESKCHPCLTKEEYIYCVNQAKSEGQLVTVDINPNMEPDVTCNVHEENWTKNIQDIYGNEFDITIDTIGDTNPETDYSLSVKKLMKQDGIFYGFKNGEKYVWFNTSTSELGYWKI